MSLESDIHPSYQTSLVFSHSLEQLVERFSSDYRGAISDPFHPPEVIFASPISKQWLTQELTESMQVVAGLQGKFIESYLWDCLSRDFLFEGQYPVKLLKVEVLQHHLIELLERETLEEIQAEFLIEYLEEEGQFNETKRIQLAMKISQLFLEYELNRPPVIGTEVPGIADTWIDSKSYLQGFAGRHLSEDVLNEERWQIELYKRLFTGLLSRRAGIQYLTLPQIWKLRLSDQQGKLYDRETCHEILKGLFNDQPLFIFAISSPAHFHRNLLAEISAFKPIYAYLLNPCGHFWEDLERYSKSDKSLTQEIREYLTLNPEDFGAESITAIENLKLKSGEGDNQLLRQWANAGRENVTLWSQFFEYDFEYLTPVVEPTTQLSHLQQSIIEREALGASEQVDHSLMLFQAPSKVREIETIRDLIFEMLSGEGPYALDGLKPHEIGVYFPDLASYLGPIEQVFGASEISRNGYLPYSILSANSSHSWYSRAVESLLALLEGEFNRMNITQFFRNPFVQEALGVDTEAIQQWESWIFELNIYRGYHEDDLRRYGDAEPSSLKTWKLALDRMVAAWMMDSALDEIEPWTDMSYADESIQVKFCDSIKKLYQAIQSFQQCHSAADFQNLMMDFLGTWVAIPLDFLNEKTVRTQLMMRLSQFADQSTSTHLSEYTAWLKGNLEGDIPGRNDAKAGHIVFGSLVHAQVLPYKVIFVAGMNAGDFPGAMNPSAIDLLSSVRILGDHHLVDNNKLAFLELILQAQDKLIFSYQAQNIQKEEELQPSSVLLEFKSYLKERKFNLQTRVIPLLSRDKRLVENWINPPDSNQSTDWRVWAPRDLMYWESTAPNSDEMNFQKQHPKIIQKAYLKSFLESPLDFHIQKQLGMYDDNSIDVGVQIESPYSLDALGKSLITQRIIDDFVQEYLSNFNHLVDVEAYVETQVESLIHSQIQKGELPEGRFESRQVKEIKEDLTLVVTHMMNTYTQSDTNVSTLDYKSSVSMTDEIELQFPAPFMVNHKGVLTLFKANTSRVETCGRHMLDLWLSALYVAAFTDAPIQIQHFGLELKDGKKFAKQETQQFSLSSTEAVEWVQMILRDIEEADYTEHIPFGTITKLIKRSKAGHNFNEEEFTADAFMEKLESDNPQNSGYYPKTEMVGAIQYTVPENVYEIVKRRLEDFLDLEISNSKDES